MYREHPPSRRTAPCCPPSRERFPGDPMNAIVPEVTGALLRRVAAGALCFLALGAAAQSRPMASLAVAQPPAAAPAYDTPPPQPMAESRLESLGMGDMVRVTVFRNPDLT